MSRLATRPLCYFTSTIGSKQIMGLTGLLWCGFLFGHMAGNMLLFVSAEAYNKYGHAITSNPLLYLIETVLLMTLLGHIVKGFLVTARNKMSRGQTPAVGLSGDKDSSFAVKTMIFQGVIILVFIVIHLLSFKFGAHYEVTYDGQTIRDLHRLLVEKFQSPVYTLGYIGSMLVLFFHLSHGFYSSIQTLGIHHPSWNPKIQILGHVFAALVAFGFMSQPIYVFLVHKN